jgi:hypothetical protein
VARVSTTRELIICVAESAGDAEIFLKAPWAGRWTTVWREPAEGLARRIGPHLRLRPGMALPQFHGGQPALWLSELEQLDLAMGEAAWATIVFQRGMS